MVTYSDTARQDLEDILYGLVTWEKHPLSFDHAKRYVSEIRAEADTVDQKRSHTPTVNMAHRLYGNYVHTYHRNRQTRWHVIYHWSASSCVAMVTKILNNFTTTALSPVKRHL
ncbi:MAG: hypothetical protein LBS63_04910 [Prevotellaceae bacterium]|jgi:plasmid stabilization system protein ParE|nr:hypothetical protein [Prevotellaceae bacterium]